SAAGVFTTNIVRAAPVDLGIERLRSRAGSARGILAISGVANALTGFEGRSDNEQVLGAAEDAFGIDRGSLLPACTGVIGPRIPVPKVLGGLTGLGAGLTSDRPGAERAAHAILTTDTRSKESAVRVRLASGDIVRIGGMAKGSGMIAPRMALPHATTLGFVTTDARVDPDALAHLLHRATESTFNMISVDGDTSTNDTLYALASGSVGGPSAHDDEAFLDGFHAVLESLARQVAQDGEGATKLLTVQVRGARTLRDARAAARAVVSSTLVKAALFGADPNVGRIAAALGYSGAVMDLGALDVSILRPRQSVPLIVDGRPAPGLDNGGGKRVRELLRQLDEVPLDIDLGEGHASATAWGCDLSYAYVQINAAYRT
ncbi:MAG: bifunctional glutamate N-acetyltransferase/amino-acid acetyltransferase ArgJ, partial [Thermoplasmata archaeon]|nr:bifunctional glutamate N-acetyltransferase/amino-acid acetyltransferase ArgJ [Thermoplasmata archaeon]